MSFDPKQFQFQSPQPQGYDPNAGFNPPGGFDPNAGYDPNSGFGHDPNLHDPFGQGPEFATYSQRKKDSYWRRIGGGSLTLSILLHAIFILIALFVIKIVVEDKKEEPVDFLPGGGGGGKGNKATMDTKRRAVTMNTPRSRIAANVKSSDVVLPEAPQMTTESALSALAMPTAGGMGGGEGGIKGKGKGGLFGDGRGKGVGPGSGIGFVGKLPSIMQSRCSPQERLSKLKANGGNEDCEKAVVKALDWLQKNQNSDGSWGKTWKTGMTGLALLAYYGHCETPDSPKYGETVMKGITYLVGVGQKNSGFLTERLGSHNHCVYEHGIAAYALGETYSFSKLGKRELPGMREAFEKAVDIIIRHQQPRGSWGYGGDSAHYDSSREDMSVTGWQFQALKAATHTGLKLDGLRQSIKKVEEYIESRQTADGGFGHHAERGKAYGQYTMTGIGVLCLQTFSGSNAKAKKGIKFIIDQIEKDPMEWKKNGELYNWYYTAQAVFQVGGKEWDIFNNQIRDQILKNQNPEGDWQAEGGGFGAAMSDSAGADANVYRTCLCTLILEVYYRYLKVGDRPGGSSSGGLPSL